MTPDPADLLLFARIVEAGSFVRAAERSQLPTSTLSRRLSALEEQLGERLLLRTTRTLTLTDFGAAVLEHARQIEQETAAAQALAEHRQQAPSGTLRVSMPNDFAAHLLAPMLAEYGQRYPEVQVLLDLSPGRVDLIAEGYDLVIRMGALPDDASLVARRIWNYCPGLYAAPAYLAQAGIPAHPADLEHHRLLCLLARSGDPVSWELQFGEERYTPQVAARLAVNSPDMLLRLAEQGLGIVGCSPVFAASRLESGRLQPVLPGWRLPMVTGWAVYPGRRLLPLKTRAFLELLEAFLSFAR
ncbi:LysR family transcriptional regulator [Chitinilyticum litopenaei]|uniref:LysR family transcriptional regulator n=1 Tax=Chitinilyticum litopenaei TaxID=1121276 RepID=UPI0003FA6881|nr:LysR family transcriptional regulator [Chitinilyticum litopenaei]